MMNDQKTLTIVGWRSRGREIALVLGIGATALILGAVIGESRWLYLVAIVFLAGVLLWPVQVTLGLFTFLVPFESLTALGGGDGGKRTVLWFVGAAAIGVLFLAGLVDKRLQRPPCTVWWWGAFLLWAGITSLWAIDPQTAGQRLVTVGALWLLYLAASSFQLSKKEFDWLVWLSILGGCAASVFSAYQYYTGATWAGGGRATVVVGENEMNPNIFAIKLLVPISLIAGRLLAEHRSWRKGVLVAALGLNLFAVLLTSSRGALVALVVMFGVYLVRMRPSRQLVIAVSLLLVLSLAMPGIFFQRWREAAATGGAGRLDVWMAGLHAIRHYAFFGAGFGGFPAAYSRFAGYAPHFSKFGRDAHNLYLMTWVETGAVGMVLFLGSLWKEVVLAARRNRHHAAPLLTACEAGAYGMFAVSFFNDILWEKSYWLALIFLACGAALKKVEDEAEPPALEAPVPTYWYVRRPFFGD